jgi:hypothetical protein
MLVSSSIKNRVKQRLNLGLEKNKYKSGEKVKPLNVFGTAFFEKAVKKR